MIDNLGDRMKRYEDASRIYLPERMPVILRLDGKAFHTYTRGCERPYDGRLMMAMDEVTKYLCANVQNCVLAYTQSDEISLLLINFKDIDTNSWFDNNLSKMVSVSAGLASVKLTLESPVLFGEHRPALFDCRAFVMPMHDVENYFIWRQKDWFRNSIQMLAQSLYSHKQLQGMKSADLHEMCFQKGKNWADLSSHIKNGRVFFKRQVPVQTQGFNTILRSEWHCPEETPIFTAPETREFVRNLMKLQEPEKKTES